MEPIVRRASEIPEQPAKRAGLAERRLLGPADSPHQNLVLVRAEAGASVEVHPVPNSESLVVLEGTIRAFGPGFAATLGPGDCAHFPPGFAHGMTVEEGPARYLVVFAPARL